MALAQSQKIAKQQVEQLMEWLARNPDVYCRPDYKETQVRVEFIDSFFEGQVGTRGTTNVVRIGSGEFSWT